MKICSESAVPFPPFIFQSLISLNGTDQRLDIERKVELNRAIPTAIVNPDRIQAKINCQGLALKMNVMDTIDRSQPTDIVPKYQPVRSTPKAFNLHKEARQTLCHHE